MSPETRPKDCRPLHTNPMVEGCAQAVLDPEVIGGCIEVGGGCVSGLAALPLTLLSMIWSG